MLEKLKDLILVLASDKWVGSLARHLATVAAGWLLALGLSPEVVTPFQEALVPILTAVSLILVSLLGSRKSKQ